MSPDTIQSKMSLNELLNNEERWWFNTENYASFLRKTFLYGLAGILSLILSARKLDAQVVNIYEDDGIPIVYPVNEEKDQLMWKYLFENNSDVEPEANPYNEKMTEFTFYNVFSLTQPAIGGSLHGWTGFTLPTGEENYWNVTGDTTDPERYVNPGETAWFQIVTDKPAGIDVKIEELNASGALQGAGPQYDQALGPTGIIIPEINTKGWNLDLLEQRDQESICQTVTASNILDTDGQPIENPENYRLIVTTIDCKFPALDVDPWIGEMNYADPNFVGDVCTEENENMYFFALKDLTLFYAQPCNEEMVPYTPLFASHEPMEIPELRLEELCENDLGRALMNPAAVENGDWMVNLQHYVPLSNNWLGNGPDFNKDNLTDVYELAVFCSRWQEEVEPDDLNK